MRPEKLKSEGARNSEQKNGKNHQAASNLFAPARRRRRRPEALRAPPLAMVQSPPPRPEARQRAKPGHRETGKLPYAELNVDCWKPVPSFEHNREGYSLARCGA